MQRTKVIIGLGNYGAKYLQTRHNAGFLFLDYLSTKWSLEWNDIPVHQYTYSQASVESTKLILIKPQTFMNLSGKVVKQIVDKYLLDLQNLYLVHDDLDIPLGEFKIQFAKGPKVHNGLLSVYQSLGSQKFWHLRIGVDARACLRQESGSEYVLKPLLNEEKLLLNKVFDKLFVELNTNLQIQTD